MKRRMKELLALVALFGLTGTGAKGETPIGVSFAYENFYVDENKGRARVILKVQNNTTEALRSVYLDCAFMDKNERTMDTAVAIAPNVPAHQAAYADTWSAQMEGIDKVLCRIVRAQ